MINLAVINLKDILNILKKIIFAIILIIIISKFMGSIKKGNYVKMDDLKTNIFCNYEELIGKTLIISNYYNNSTKTFSKESGIKKILVSELAIFNTEEKLMEKENQEETLEFKDNKENNVSSTNNENENKIDNVDTKTDPNVNIENIASTLPTKVLSENNVKETYTDLYHSVKIKNESKYPLTEEMVTPNVDFTNKKDIVIYHTHTCESYTPTEANNYEASGNFRTTDLNYSVARVGTELTNYLSSSGFNVNHDLTYHDYPAYTGSYTRGLSTIKSIISNNPNSQFVIDLHRDALGSNSGYAPRVQIGEEVAAQVMFVIGTDGGGLEHKNWLNNLKLAIRVQEKANEMYPGLFRPIILRNSRYNQHVTTGACIIEVGATGNTLEQCNTSMKYLSKVIEELMR